MEKLTAERAKALSVELVELSKLQYDSLQKAAYFRMNAEEAIKYDERRLRIAEVSKALGEFKANSF
jgi:hypothetical protein